MLRSNISDSRVDEITELGCLIIKARIPADQEELIVKSLEMALDESDDVPAGTPAAKWYAGEEVGWDNAVFLLFR